MNSMMEDQLQLAWGLQDALSSLWRFRQQVTQWRRIAGRLQSSPLPQAVVDLATRHLSLCLWRCIMEMTRLQARVKQLQADLRSQQRSLCDAAHEPVWHGGFGLQWFGTLIEIRLELRRKSPSSWVTPCVRMMVDRVPSAASEADGAIPHQRGKETPSSNSILSVAEDAIVPPTLPPSPMTPLLESLRTPLLLSPGPSPSCGDVVPGAVMRTPVRVLGVQQPRCPDAGIPVAPPVHVTQPTSSGNIPIPPPVPISHAGPPPAPAVVTLSSSAGSARRASSRGRGFKVVSAKTRGARTSQNSGSRPRLFDMASLKDQLVSARAKLKSVEDSGNSSAGPLSSPARKPRVRPPGTPIRGPDMFEELVRRLANRRQHIRQISRLPAVAQGGVHRINGGSPEHSVAVGAPIPVGNVAKDGDADTTRANMTDQEAVMVGRSVDDVQEEQQMGEDESGFQVAADAALHDATSVVPEAPETEVSDSMHLTAFSPCTQLDGDAVVCLSVEHTRSPSTHGLDSVMEEEEESQAQQDDTEAAVPASPSAQQKPEEIMEVKSSDENNPPVIQTVGESTSDKVSQVAAEDGQEQRARVVQHYLDQHIGQKLQAANSKPSKRSRARRSSFLMVLPSEERRKLIPSRTLSESSLPLPR